MFVSKISLWGAAIVAYIVLVAMMALAFFVANILAGVIALRMIKKNKAFING